VPLNLEGSCRCGTVSFSVDSHAPYPYQLCYCSICRKTAGGGGYAINLHGDATTLKIKGKRAIGLYRAEIESDGHCETSSAERNFCKRCASALWVHDPGWPDLIHPFASAIDTALPKAPERVRLMLNYAAPWCEIPTGEHERHFPEYPEESLEEWHLRHGL